MPPSPPTRTPSRWNGLTTEERQRERRRLLIDAAFELLSTEGAAGTTVRAVCTRARLNPRYFYESFDELDELLVAVYDDVVMSMRRRVTATVAAADPADAVRATVEATVRFIDEDRRRGQVMYVEALGNEKLNRRRVQTGFDLVDVVQRDRARLRGTPGSEQLDRMVGAVLVGGVTELLSAWLDGRITLEIEDLVDHATALFVAVGQAADGFLEAGTPSG